MPLVAKVSNLANGLDIHNLYLEMLKPFCIPAKDTFNNNDTSGSTAIAEVTGRVDNVPVTGGVATPFSVKEVEPPSELQFYLTDKKGIVKNSKIVMNEPIAMTGVPEQVHVLVCWPGKLIEQYDTRLLNSLPEIFKSGFLPKRPQESVSLFKCLEAFLTEEPLGPEDMWSVSTLFFFLALASGLFCSIYSYIYVNI